MGDVSAVVFVAKNGIVAFDNAGIAVGLDFQWNCFVFHKTPCKQKAAQVFKDLGRG
jgi:hypothetical protein